MDSTLPLLLDPYRFIGRKCWRRGNDVVESRLLLRPANLMTGPEAARLFYDEDRFRRAGATPRRIRDSLLGRGGVQGMDGPAHRRRKAMIMSVVEGERIDALSRLVEEIWLRNAAGWRGSISFLDEMEKVLAEAAWRWAGVPGRYRSGFRSTLTSLYDGAGAVGPRHWASRYHRVLADRRIEGFVEGHRRGETVAAPDSPFAVVASHRDDSGRLLAPRVAAVEVLNLLRPLVATSIYMSHVAHALAEHPHWRRRVAEDSGSETRWFTEEVRRTYPFFPAMVALAAVDFEWGGQRFRRGQRVLLDVYGTNHHPESWMEPHAFDPDRFNDRSPGEFQLIPQGGGDHYRHHRCAGEGVVLQLMDMTVRLLGTRMRYSLPPQRLDLDLRRIPALPRDRLVMSDVAVL